VTDTDTEIELGTIAHLDFEEERACESVDHGKFPSVHRGEATHLQTTPCGHADGLRCSRWVRYCESGGMSRCGICNDRSPCRFIPLDNT